MAEQHMTVCVEPPDDPADPDALRAAIGKAMAPYFYDREDIPHPDWVGEWDYWAISGANFSLRPRPGDVRDGSRRAARAPTGCRPGNGSCSSPCRPPGPM
ncbi:hypothetical protein GCM10009566_31290 [Streptomyces murinus]